MNVATVSWLGSHHLASILSRVYKLVFARLFVVTSLVKLNPLMLVRSYTSNLKVKASVS